ncbi:MAG: PsbP-related protein [Pseudomonadota bacterium]
MKLSVRLGALFLLLPVISACEYAPLLPWYWKRYEHPTYRFSLKVPRNWQVELSGAMQAAAVFLAPEEDRLFRANLNVVVQPKPPKLDLKGEAMISLQQLRLLMSEYELLSDAPTRLGSFEAYEIRGKYRGAEGYRVLRTILALSDDAEYVVTFTCREERETAFQEVVKKILASFQAPRSLSARS